ncbi:nucleotidyltransferase domain-containing protein [Spirillospora sp. NBC_00431]
MRALICADAVRAALRPVSLRPEEVIDVLGSCLDGDEVYLVGSLAAGLGNAGSDVDLHVFVRERAEGVVPMLFFAGRTRLDLVHYETGTPSAALARTPTRNVALLDGRCALGPLPPMTDLKRLSRWATSVPLYEGTPPIFTPEETARIAAALVRLAIDVAVRAAALASVMAAARAPLAGLAWSRAAEAAVEAAVRARGEIFVGDKWLPAKARRSGFPSPLLADARRVASATDFDRFTGRLGLPLRDPAELVRLTPTEAPDFTFGETTFQLVGEYLLHRLDLPSESLNDALKTLDASSLAEAITHGAVTLATDPAEVDGRLA